MWVFFDTHPFLTSHSDDNILKKIVKPVLVSEKKFVSRIF
jgi:hypothetical protein